MEKNRKEEIFRAILEIVSEKGPGGVSTLEVARRIGVSQPALYRHFKNREEMILFFVEGLERELNGILARALETGKGDPAEELDQLLELHLRMVDRNQILPRVIFSDLIHQGDVRKKEALRKVLGGYGEGIRGILNRGIKEKRFRAVDPDTAVQSILGLVLAGALFRLLELETGETPERRIQHCRNFIQETLHRKES